MRTATGCIEELYLDEKRAARISCRPELVPAPGQYLMARAENAPYDPLATPVFAAGAAPGGFLAAPPLPPGWYPGLRLQLRGPNGQGFSLPASARRVALADFSDSGARLLALLPAALAQNAAVCVLAARPPDGLPPSIEISPLAALPEIAHWADYLALDLAREQLANLPSMPGAPGVTQVLVRAPMPCAALAECGACAIRTRRGPRLVCKDGPVFDINLLG